MYTLAQIFGTLLIGLLRGYRLLISPILPQTCRFYPSCSTYAIDAVQEHGPVRGGLLGLHRIIRCNPWGKGGYDPVPGKDSPQ